ncbi:MAG: outer membrane beta-barrel protein [Labilithrix sp.]|nr:outer membrane beta-barrel protein [Labilithrix sp.]
MRIALAAASTFAALSLFAARAHAVERQHHIGLAPSLSLLKVDDKSTMSVGMGGALHYTYGLSDQFNLMAEFNSSIVALDQQQDTAETPKTRPATVDHLSLGLGYVIDVLRWVPYVGVLPGVYRLAGGTLDGSLFLPGAALAVGLDYQLSRHWAIGAAAHQHFLFTKMSTYPSYTTGLLRLEYMWGF